jgi:hypothetical protein
MSYNPYLTLLHHPEQRIESDPAPRANGGKCEVRGPCSLSLRNGKDGSRIKKCKDAKQ